MADVFSGMAVIPIAIRMNPEDFRENPDDDNIEGILDDLPETHKRCGSGSISG